MDKVVVITGASGGIGAAVARMLHDAGASVGLASRRGDDLGLERAVGAACDVRDPEAVDAAVAATVDRFGSLDIVVANAGVGAYGPFLELSREHPRR
jgi:3-oxoacyl-[acyl-carrier protein] reductase